MRPAPSKMNRILFMFPLSVHGQVGWMPVQGGQPTV
jgi:hypothetical protein